MNRKTNQQFKSSVNEKLDLQNDKFNELINRFDNNDIKLNEIKTEIKSCLLYTSRCV